MPAPDFFLARNRTRGTYSPPLVLGGDADEVASTSGATRLTAHVEDEEDMEAEAAWTTLPNWEIGPVKI